MKGLFKKQLTFFLYGFVFWLPVILVVYVAALLFSNAEKAGRTILGVVVPDQFLYTGLGFVFCILIVYLSGMLLKLSKVGKILSKIPFIGLFFGQGEIMTIGKLSHMQACLFLYSPTCISYGWILSEEKVTLSGNAGKFPIVNVYFPNVPTLVTGQVLAARKETVMKLANTSSEITNLLLYAFRSPAALKFLPWEEESPEEFQKRSEIFGLK
ncbi:MAG: hypothetical protein PHE50_02875 [Dehalococcoidales bacterium]|nr:hypothetical protein [Dehalococcoidales bacterium]